MPNKYIYFALLLFAFVACRPEKIKLSEDLLLEVKTTSDYHEYYKYDKYYEHYDVIYSSGWSKERILKFLLKYDITLAELKDSSQCMINLISDWADSMRDDGKKTVFPYTDSLNFLLEANNLVKNDIMPNFDVVRLQHISMNIQFVFRLINKFAREQSNFYYRSRPAKEVLLLKRTPNVDTIAIGDTLQLLYSVVPKWQDSLYMLSIGNDNQSVMDTLYAKNNTFRWTFVANKKGVHNIRFNYDINSKYKKLELVDIRFYKNFQIVVE
jgi:hypothetical protein